MQEEVTALVTQRLRPLEPSEVAERESDITGALGLLWDQHVAHGDVALRNLVVDNAGAVRLIDFGDARRCGSRDEAKAVDSPYLAGLFARA